MHQLSLAHLSRRAETSHCPHLCLCGVTTHRQLLVLECLYSTDVRQSPPHDKHLIVRSTGAGAACFTVFRSVARWDQLVGGTLPSWKMLQQSCWRSSACWRGASWSDAVPYKKKSQHVKLPPLQERVPGWNNKIAYGSSHMYSIFMISLWPLHYFS